MSAVIERVGTVPQVQKSNDLRPAGMNAGYDAGYMAVASEDTLIAYEKRIMAIEPAVRGNGRLSREQLDTIVALTRGISDKDNF